MQSYPQNIIKELPETLKAKLGLYREMRAFDANKYIDQKSQMLNKYYKDCGLDSAVVAVSGGIDSAIVLSIVANAQKLEDSPIKNIYPLLLPSDYGVTNQDNSLSQGVELCEGLGLHPNIINMAPITKIIQEGNESGLGVRGNKWAVGQLVAYARTPVLYYATSLITANGGKGLIVGTTNLDECSYLGYIGKASDGMVDVQLISDIHKSEVYAVARELKVPQSILDATPNGDMYDARVDEEVFGAPYDFVELYLYYLSLDTFHKKVFALDIPKEDMNIFNQLKKNLDDLHRYNGHKYKVGSPAYHLDIPELIYFKKQKYGWGIDYDQEAV